MAQPGTAQAWKACFRKDFWVQIPASALIFTMETWNKFWKSKGSKMEWNQEDILKSKSLKEYKNLIQNHFNKKNLSSLTLLELGSGMGITSYYFANEGIKVTLLDQSKEVKSLAKKFWKNRQFQFIQSDLFKYNSKERFDIITSFGLCEHFTGKKRTTALQLHVNLLKNKGLAIISVPYKYGIFYRIYKALAELTGQWDFGIEAPFSKSELIQFAKDNHLNYELHLSGFYSSAYDLIRKPFKLFKINIKRRFDSNRSFLDNYLGPSIILVLKK